MTRFFTRFLYSKNSREKSSRLAEALDVELSLHQLLRRLWYDVNGYGSSSYFYFYISISIVLFIHGSPSGKRPDLQKNAT